MRAPQNPEIFDKDMRVSKQNDPDRILQYLADEKNIAQIHQALILGIRDYFSKMGFAKAILGSSGGIDSAVTLALACEALGPDNVRALLLPSPIRAVIRSAMPSSSPATWATPMISSPSGKSMKHCSIPSNLFSKICRLALPKKTCKAAPAEISSWASPINSAISY